MSHLYTLVIHYMNGSKDELPFDQYSAVRDFYQHCISYSGGRVRRVEVIVQNSNQAIWDHSWDQLSKHKGLMQ